MRLELKDLASGKLHSIEDGGAVVGSDPKKASLVVAAPGVAPAHARVSVRDGRFVVEDLGSPVGTLVSGVRIKTAVELRAGSTLSVSTCRFQVTRVGTEAVDDLQELLRDIDGTTKGAAGGTPRTRTPATSARPASAPIPIPAVPSVSAGGSAPSAGTARGVAGSVPSAAAPTPRSAPRPPAPTAAAPAPTASPAPATSTPAAASRPAPPASARAPAAPALRAASPSSPSATPASPAANPPTTAPSPAPARPAASGTAAGRGPRPEAVRDDGLGEVASSFAASLVDAILRYGRMAAALLLRPEATLRSGVVAPQVGSLTAMDLLPWAVPPALALSLVTALASGVTTRSASSLVGVAEVLTAGVVGGIVASLLAAVLWHPVVTALVSLLGGGSDARLRANAFVAHGVGVVVLAGGLLAGVVVSAIPWPPAATAPIVFGVIATVPLLLVWRAWGQRLGLGRALDVALVVVALAVLAGAARGVSAIMAGPRFAESRVDAELGAAATHLDQIQARAAAVRETVAPAQEEEPGPSARSSLAEYRRRRDVIDRTVRADSTVLGRVDRLARLYTRLQRETDKVDRELSRRAKKGKRLPGRRREAVLQSRTGALVDEVYELLTRRR